MSDDFFLQPPDEVTGTVVRRDDLWILGKRKPGRSGDVLMDSIQASIDTGCDPTTSKKRPPRA